jgi:hypothetical protein
MTTNFLERIWTFNQTSKGIEASNVAYYLAEWLVEQQLIYTGVTKYQPWNIQPFNETIGSNTGRALRAITGAFIVPSLWNGNSPFDSNYSIVTLGNPIQLVIPNGLNWGDVIFDFRVPRIGSGGIAINPAYNGSGFILWTLGYTGASLFASGETNIFQWVDINIPTSTRFWSFQGISNSGSNLSVGSFYNDISNEYLGTSGVKCTGLVCTLKLSLIRPVPLSDGRVIPFLEYRINFGTGNMIIDSEAYSYGFFRSKTVKIPQITTNTALDFAILQ